MSAILIRVRSSSGTLRIQVPKDSNLQALKELVAKDLKASASDLSLFLDEGGKAEIQSSNIKSFEIGQMIYAKVKEAAVIEQESLPELDEVDLILARDTGLVERVKDKQMCQHGPKGMCAHCQPLEPYDPAIMEERHINFLSFQAYLRKTKNAPMNQHRFVIKPCTKHPPWPLAICTDCQPRSMTFVKQKYRHVDAIEFQSANIMNTFLDNWRATGAQRYGFLYGTYQRYDQTPLGVKAVVSAIYEPPQVGTENSIDIKEDPDAARVDHIAKLLGLKKVGWIFSDLEILAGQTGHASKVVCSRHKESYFLKMNEVVLAAHFQNQNPSRCDLAENGRFGSKFVTVVVSGDRENNIVPEAYQMSQQAMDLEFDNVFEHSDDPSVARIAVSDKNRFLPEILYKTKSEFGIDVTRRADPTCPLDYFIISLSCIFSSEPARFHLEHFPIENRPHSPQTVTQLSSYMNKYRERPLLDMLSNFHLLVYLGLRSEVAGLLDDEHGLPLICRAVRERDESLAAAACSTHFWSEIVARSLSAGAGSGPSPSRGGGGSSSSSLSALGQASWVCSVCTFINKPSSPSCDMCGAGK